MFVSLMRRTTPSFDDCSFAVEGLKLSGAVCRNNQLAISSEISTNLHLTRLRWIKKTECKSKIFSINQLSTSEYFSV